MDTISLIKKLSRPLHKVDAVIDTDAYNEIDDQYAISYMLKSPNKINTRAIFAAPFFNSNSKSPEDGMEKSYNEILNLLNLMNKPEMIPNVYKGSREYMVDEETPIDSPAAHKLVELADEYTKENPLYVVAIGAITNVVSAILMNPSITEKIIVIWLGGHSLEWNDTHEFNMFQDVRASRVLFDCGVPMIQFPCMGVASAFSVSEFEFNALFKGKNPLCNYLVKHTIEYTDCHSSLAWSRILWDVTAVSWLTGDFCESRLISSPIPEYDGHYASDPRRHFIRYVYHIKRDLLLADLVEQLTK